MVARINSQLFDAEAAHSVIEFPAEYGIKIMGLDEPVFDKTVKGILNQHLDDKQSVAYGYKKSAKQNYVSITCTFVAQSRQQLDEIYAQMRCHPKVLMVL